MTQEPTHAELEAVHKNDSAASDPHNFNMEHMGDQSWAEPRMPTQAPPKSVLNALALWALALVSWPT